LVREATVPQLMMLGIVLLNGVVVMVLGYLFS